MNDHELKLVEEWLDTPDQNEPATEDDRVAENLLGPQVDLPRDEETLFRCKQCGGSPKRKGQLGYCLRCGHDLDRTTISKIRISKR